jgi:hypothetical protein
MDLAKVLADLRQELANLDSAISSLERLQEVSSVHRRGRPPKLLSDIRKAAPDKPEPRAAQPSGPKDV